MKTPREDATRNALQMGIAAAMVALHRAGVPADAQAMLAYGDERGTVAPRAIHKAVEAGLVAFLDHMNGHHRPAGFNLAREVEEVAESKRPKAPCE